MHDLNIRNVTVRENNGIDLELPDQGGQFGFVEDRNARRISFSCQLWRVRSAGNSRNLEGRKGFHLVAGIIAEVDIKVVEIPPGSPHYDNLFLLCDHDETPI